jgi:DNA-binding transcriptional LysR family regulator
VIVAADMGSTGEGMEVHPLMVEPFVVAAPKGAVKGDVLAQLRQMPLIQYTTRHYMGRLIADHLVRQNLMLAHRFEMDSYHAIMAMVAQGAGWTILTPLGWMRAQRFQGQVDVLPLPFAPLSRIITLTARRGVLGDMPAGMVGRLKPLLAEMIVAPAVAQLPWLKDGLRVL